MHIKVLKGKTSDLLACKDASGDFYVQVPAGSTRNLKTAADWAAYFASGVFSDEMPTNVRSAYRAAFRPHQPAPIPDGYAQAISGRDTGAMKPSPRFASGHTATPDGYASNLPVVPADVDERDGYAVALSERSNVRQFPSSDTDGYAAAIARRKVS